jgi:hypothetical protein
MKRSAAMVMLALAGCVSAAQREKARQQDYFACRAAARDSVFAHDSTPAHPGPHHHVNPEVVRLTKACLVREHGWSASEADRWVEARLRREG